MPILLALVLIASLACSSPTPSSIPVHPRASVVLITIDALRPDRVGCYGYDRATTPNIDALAARGFRFTNAFTQAPISSVAHAGLLTGLYPTEHGVRDDGVYALSDDAVTLAETFDSAGYETAAVVGSAALGARFGFGQGFGSFDDHIDAHDARWPVTFAGVSTLRYERPATAVVEAARKWLSDRSSDSPFFLWVNVVDCTAPYDPPGGPVRRWGTSVDSLTDVVVNAPEGSYPTSLSALSDAYDDEVAYVDAAIGPLINALPPECLVVFLGSHGESLGEHGIVGHGTQLFDESVRVPFIVSAPHVRIGVVDDRLVQLTDVAPTLLDVVGVTPLTPVSGMSLRDGGTRSNVYAETRRPQERGTAPERLMLRTETWKAMFGAGHVLTRLFDVSADPAERVNRLASERRVGRDLRDRLRSLLDGLDTPARGVSPDVEAQLRSLGYVGGTDSGAVDEAWSRIRSGIRALYRGDAPRAVSFLSKARPSDAWARLRLAEAYRMNGDLERAESIWTEPASVSEDPAVWFARARAARARGDAATERQCLRAVIEAAPQFLDARVRLADMCVAEGRTDDAYHELAEARRAAPGDPRLPLLERLVTKR